MKKMIDLSGSWDVYLDADDRGLTGRWYEVQNLTEKESHSITLPGSLEIAGIGDPITEATEWVGSQFGNEFTRDPLYEPYHDSANFRFPYWLQPETRFIGPAWYVKKVTLPRNREITWNLVLERPHWETRVWMNGIFIGSCDSLSVSHRYEIPEEIDSDVVLIIRVDNRMIHKVGPNAHSISDHTQGPWNGIVGELSLIPVPKLSLGTIQVFSNVHRFSLLCAINVTNQTNEQERITIYIERAGKESVSLTKLIPPGTTTFHMEVNELPLWDEYSPNLVELRIVLVAEHGQLDEKVLSAGLRSIKAKGKHLFVNGKQIYLRGTVECCVFPKTGHPPMEEEYWEHIFSQSKEYGLNHLRFHSWCPPEAAFTVADRMGFYLQIECPIWKNQGVAFDENRNFDDWLFAESERIVSEYGNHPSFLFFASGNEPDGRDKEILGLWTSYWNQKDQRRLHVAASGWPELEENAFQVLPQPRIQAWGEGLASRINAQKPETSSDYNALCEEFSGAIVTHEMGQWCVFPDFSEISEYTGYLKPRNFEIFADILTRRGLAEQAEQFLQASGFQQVLCYKEEIETALRSENLAGFQLLALTDFPGQGTALEGVLNAFWQEKGYCNGQQFRMFCNDIVLLARLPKRYYTAGETLFADVELANFGSVNLEKIDVTWSLSNALGVQIHSGVLCSQQSSPRGLHSLPSLSLLLPKLDTAEKVTLTLTLEEPRYVNTWDLWLFPIEQKIEVGNVFVTSEWNETTQEMLKSGGNVLLHALGSSEVALGFSSVFWNTSWTGMQAPHTLGMVIDAQHPIFSAFPTDGHSDWQWWELVHNANTLILDDCPVNLSPIVQPIDTWFRSHKLGLLLECRVGLGNLVITSMDVTTDLENRIVARQLFHSILLYMKGEQFRPNSKLTLDEVSELLSNQEAI